MELVKEEHLGRKGLYNKSAFFIKNNMILVIAFIAAFLSALVVPPDKEYLNYLDIRTLSTLFSMLAIVSSYSEIRFFEYLSIRIVSVFKSSRSVILALVYVSFIGSMIIANDMALITFLPLGYYVLKSTNNEKYMAFTFIMQNISANLGGMLTPFGNPQNLYIYSYYGIDSLEFMEIMLVPFLVSIILISLACLLIKREELKLVNDSKITINKGKLLINNILFIIFLGGIFRLIPHFYALIIILITLLICDRKALVKTDYSLLLTFCMFFIFAGNMSRIDLINDLLSNLLMYSTLFTGLVACQFISNVPSAILLSKFTSNYRELLIAVNIGAAGSLIASLASLITYKEFVKHNPDKKLAYIKQFTIINFSFLVIILLILFLFNKLNIF